MIACLLVVPSLGLHKGWGGGSQAICYNLSGATGSERFPDMRLQSSNSAIKSLCFFLGFYQLGWHCLLSTADPGLLHTSSVNKKCGNKLIITYMQSAQSATFFKA